MYQSCIDSWVWLINSAIFMSPSQSYPPTPLIIDFEIWGPEQMKAFTHVKEELTKPTILALYETKISADASSYSLGAVLL